MKTLSLKTESILAVTLIGFGLLGLTLMQIESMRDDIGLSVGDFLVHFSRLAYQRSVLG